jgi:uncharacterized protein (TIGR02001 family)
MSHRVLRPALPFALLAVCHPLQAADVGNQLALASDYVFRGISQANGRPAMQAGARVDGEDGFYGSVWASRVDFPSVPDARAEVDYVLGIRQPLSADWVGELNATWFTYAGASELNYLEWIATATWRDLRWVALGVSNDVFATGRSGVYANAGLRVPLNDATRLEFAAGYYWLDHDYARSYAHAQATVAWQLHPKLELRLSGHLTDHNARVMFGDLADPRLEASLQASF